MDYYKIGQHIRKFRKAYNLTQEQLAEKVGISTSHMNHIETGNTKLSLPVFFYFSNALCIKTDELLYGLPQSNKTAIKEELEEIFNSCSLQELYILESVVKAVKAALNKYGKEDFENA